MTVLTKSNRCCGAFDKYHIWGSSFKVDDKQCNPGGAIGWAGLGMVCTV